VKNEGGKRTSGHFDNKESAVVGGRDWQNLVAMVR